jgi:predicted Zn-dependent peptidase
MNTVETVSVGAWVAVGTRHEQPKLNGISHLLEHLAFKGTKNRTAFNIAEEIEAVGGQLNAYTSRENTAYYAKVLKEDVALAVDLISDILQNSTIDSIELKRECEVVIQEIYQSFDIPDDIIFDRFQETAYPNQAVGRPVLGKPDLIKNISRETLLSYMRAKYSASRIVFAAAGNVQHDYLVELAEKAFCNLPRALDKNNEPIKYQGGDYREIRDLEQVHIVMGLDGVSYHDPDYYPISVLSTLLGGGMSSRLFQEIREKRGLVYNIYSFISSFEDGGIFGIYAGSGKNDVKELIPIICCELKKLIEKISDDELIRARSQLKAATLMAIESTTSRSEQIARQLQIFDRVIPVNEVISQIENVRTSDLVRISKRLLASKLTFTALGPIQNVEDYSDIQKRLN